MLKELIKLANELDRFGLHAQADSIDKIIRMASEDDEDSEEWSGGEEEVRKSPPIQEPSHGPLAILEFVNSVHPEEIRALREGIINSFKISLEDWIRVAKRFLINESDKEKYIENNLHLIHPMDIEDDALGEYYSKEGIKNFLEADVAPFSPLEYIEVANKAMIDGGNLFLNQKDRLRGLALKFKDLMNEKFLMKDLN